MGTESLPHVFYEHFKSFSQRELPLFQTRKKRWTGWLPDSEGRSRRITILDLELCTDGSFERTRKIKLIPGEDDDGNTF